MQGFWFLETRTSVKSLGSPLYFKSRLINFGSTRFYPTGKPMTNQCIESTLSLILKSQEIFCHIMHHDHGMLWNGLILLDLYYY